MYIHKKHLRDSLANLQDQKERKKKNKDLTLFF